MNQTEFPEDKDQGSPDDPHSETNDMSSAGAVLGSNVDDSAVQLEPLDDTPIVAELVQAEPALNEVDSEYTPRNPYAESKAIENKYYMAPALDLAGELSSMASIGGAVGSLVLGIWSVVSALITHFAIVNAGLAIVLAIYGWNSPRRNLAIVGLVLGLFGTLLSLMEFNEVFSNYWTQEEI